MTAQERKKESKKASSKAKTKKRVPEKQKNDTPLPPALQYKLKDSVFIRQSEREREGFLIDLRPKKGSKVLKLEI